MDCIPKGFHAMSAPIIILTLATALKNITSLLGADVFVHDIMNQTASGLDNMLPAVIFLAACLLAFASGTSWGTFAILLPIVVAIFDPESTLLTIGISACLAGVVCGDHCSPISDTTVMSSAGGQCDHLVHVSTQLLCHYGCGHQLSYIRHCRDCAKRRSLSAGGQPFDDSDSVFYPYHYRHIRAAFPIA